MVKREHGGSEAAGGSDMGPVEEKKGGRVGGPEGSMVPTTFSNLLKSCSCPLGDSPIVSSATLRAPMLLDSLLPPPFPPVPIPDLCTNNPLDVRIGASQPLDWLQDDVGSWEAFLRYGVESGRELLRRLVDARPELVLVQEALYEKPAKGWEGGYGPPEWSSREIVAIDWMVRQPSNLSPGEPRNAEELEKLLGVKRGYVGRLVNRNGYAVAVARVAKLYVKLSEPRRQMELIAGAVNTPSVTPDGEEVRRLKPDEQLRYLRTALEVDGVIGARRVDPVPPQSFEDADVAYRRTITITEERRGPVDSAMAVEQETDDRVD